MLKLKTITAI